MRIPFPFMKVDLGLLLHAFEDGMLSPDNLGRKLDLGRT